MNDWIQRTVIAQEYQHFLNIFNTYQDPNSSLSYFRFPKLENWEWHINTQKLIFSCQLLCPIQLARDGIWGFIIFIQDVPLIFATTGGKIKINNYNCDEISIYLNQSNLNQQECLDLIRTIYPNLYADF